jgi:hypothetical protein
MRREYLKKLKETHSANNTEATSSKSQVDRTNKDSPCFRESSAITGSVSFSGNATKVSTQSARGIKREKMLEAVLLDRISKCCI